jgi:hypothetical protein
MTNISTFTHFMVIITYARSRPGVEVCCLGNLISQFLSRFWYHNFTLLIANISHFFLYVKNCWGVGFLRFSRLYQDLSYKRAGF